MWPILRTITAAFDVFFDLFGGTHPVVPLLVVSVVTGVVMLLVFGKTSNQQRIAETKDKLKAYIMEMWIFRNDTRVMFLAIGNVIRNNLRYLRHSLRPLVFILVPVLLIMVQLGIRYGSEPVAPGESARVTVTLDEGVRATELDVGLQAPFAARVASAPLRIDSSGEVEWKVLGLSPGTHELVLSTPGGPLTKTFVVAGEPGVRTVGAVRARGLTWSAFLYPSERPIPRDSVVKSIEVHYEPAGLSVFGIGLHWLLVFFVVSVAAGFALKGVFGIEV
jgi:uncharacterized membrane protein (DUF106 family)